MEQFPPCESFISMSWASSFWVPTLPSADYHSIKSLSKALGASRGEVIGLGVRLLAGMWKVSPTGVLALLDALRKENPYTGGPTPQISPYDPNKSPE